MQLQRTFCLVSCLSFIAVAVPKIESSPRGILGGLLGKPKKPECVCPKPEPQPIPIETVSTNNCSTGTPYCCSGDNVTGMVCGPASSTNCNTLTICCINTNGMQFCAGNIDFSGPITINHNYNIGCNGKRREYR